MNYDHSPRKSIVKPVLISIAVVLFLCVFAFRYMSLDHSDGVPATASSDIALSGDSFSGDGSSRLSSQPHAREDAHTVRRSPGQTFAVATTWKMLIWLVVGAAVVLIFLFGARGHWKAVMGVGGGLALLFVFGMFLSLSERSSRPSRSDARSRGQG